LPGTEQFFLFVKMVYHAPQFAAGGGHEEVYAPAVTMLFGFSSGRKLLPLLVL
jgi:hypothetical protein